MSNSRPLAAPRLKDPTLPLNTVLPPRAPQAWSEEDQVLENKGRKAFVHTWSEDGNTCTFRLDPTLSAKQRHLLSHHVPLHLAAHRRLSKSQLDAMGIVQHDPTKTYLFDVPSGNSIVVVKRSTPSLLKDLGLLDIQNEIRALLHNSAFYHRIHRIEGKKKNEHRQMEQQKPQFGVTWQ